MATPSQFTQVSAEQWAELPLQLVVVSEVFSPEIAQILTFDAMILMGQNAPFMSYLVGMWNKSPEDAVRASGSNATYPATDGKSIFIGNESALQIYFQPAKTTARDSCQASEDRCVPAPMAASSRRRWSCTAMRVSLLPASAI
jgi:hypothetical protein